MAASEDIDAIWITSANITRVTDMQSIVKGNAKRNSNLLGVACEKPLARNVSEAKILLDLAESSNIPTGYLENQVFSPSVMKGKALLWSRCVPFSSRPYLVRASEEHSGPHKPWFWKGVEQGGGVLNDMMV